jgi:hypothetical protein
LVAFAGCLGNNAFQHSLIALRGRAVTEMSSDEGKRAYRREMLLATALVAAGIAMSGVSLARIVAGNAHIAQATPPLQPAPAPAEKTTPIQDK